MDGIGPAAPAAGTACKTESRQAEQKAQCDHETMLTSGGKSLTTERRPHVNGFQGVTAVIA